MTYPIPDEALDADIAVLGKKGGGKTFTAKGIVERLLDMGRRVLVLDPLGVWAGLRTSADGARPGYPVAIFGGAHADMPLDTAAAAAMADVLARENVPAVIDLSELTKTAQQSFLLAFLHELRRVNTEALTVVLEEADVFAPQNPLGDDSKALHAELDWIARRGRFKGFRLITICQRPARLSKDVLTQAATLVVHRLPAPQDRDAVKAWVEGNGDRDLAKVVFDTLATLAVGEAWVWASEQTMLERARFPKIKTLDTSATPKAGEKRIQQKTLADVDVSAIRAALAASTPKKNTTKPTQNIPENIPDVQALIEAAEERAYLAGVRVGFRDAHQTAWLMVKNTAADLEAKSANYEILPDSLPNWREEMARELKRKPSRTRQPHNSGTDPYDIIAADNKRLPREVTTLKKPANGEPQFKSDPLLAAAHAVWPVKMTWAGLASMCGRKARGGHFNTTRKLLLQSGAVREEGDLVVPMDPPATPVGKIPADLLEENLPQPAQKMFVEIRRAPGVTITALADRLLMQPRGGHWNTGMSTLRRNGLIAEVGGGLYLSKGLEGVAT